jgi:hypothetical protein
LELRNSVRFQQRDIEVRTSDVGERKPNVSAEDATCNAEGPNGRSIDINVEIYGVTRGKSVIVIDQMEHQGCG